MENKLFKRIVIFGLPGSGKSTFANTLGQKLNIPVFHLDKTYFLPNWKIRDKNEFISMQKDMIETNSWIIEGASMKTLEMRFAKADLVLYFHLPRPLCLFRVFKRPFFHDKSLLDTAEGCSKNTVSWSLLKYLWNFDREKRAQIHALRAKYPNVIFHELKSQKEIDKFLNSLSIK